MTMEFEKALLYNIIINNRKIEICTSFIIVKINHKLDFKKLK